MLFNSLAYLAFFPTVVLLYFLSPYSWRWALLLAASCFFYMVFVPKFILILAVLILVDYGAGLVIESAEGINRRLWLLLSLAANVGMLGFFKYFNFVNSNLAALAGALRWHYPIPELTILLPIGLSFHTFQSMAYTIEVYRGAQRAERHLGRYALYVMFFPQLVAGPIERPQNLLHQFLQNHDFDYAGAVEGLKWILWGLVKKSVIADRLAIFVTAVYGDPARHSGFELTLATIFFSFQIYCDFSGYSDIAIGSAKMLGFELMDNFDAPYFARSIPEFWRRWHISLSTWFKDYLYIPLGGSRVSPLRRSFNLLVVFIVSGLWHGASWNFVIWGFLHGVYMVASTASRTIRERLAAITGLDRFPALRHGVQAASTFALVSITWVFFRARSLGDARYILSHLTQGWGAGAGWLPVLNVYGPSKKNLTLFFATAATILWSERPSKTERPLFVVSSRPLFVRWGLYSALTWALIWFGVFAESRFIYFQF